MRGQECNGRRLLFGAPLPSQGDLARDEIPPEGRFGCALVLRQLCRRNLDTVRAWRHAIRRTGGMGRYAVNTDAYWATSFARDVVRAMSPPLEAA